MRPLLLVILVAVVAVGGYLLWTYSAGGGDAVSSEQDGTSIGEEFDPEEEYVPILEVTLYRTDAVVVSRALTRPWSMSIFMWSL